MSELWLEAERSARVKAPEGLACPTVVNTVARQQVGHRIGKKGKSGLGQEGGTSLRGRFESSRKPVST